MAGSEQAGPLGLTASLAALARAFDRYLRTHPGGRTTALAALRGALEHR